MRRDVVELRRFYATRLGAAVRLMVSRKVGEAWGDAAGLDLLALGYATPFLDGFRTRPRRVVAAMPGQQGVECWPAAERNLACLADEFSLPLPNALFDRVLVAHGLEESDDPAAFLEEVWRVLAPSGRVIIVAAARMGWWADAEKTPFGHGRPFTRRQLESLVRDAELEPLAWSRALYVPPVESLVRFADAFEMIGSRLSPGLSGLILLEAVKQTFAPKPRAVRRRVPIPRGLLPTPAPAAGFQQASEEG